MLLPKDEISTTKVGTGPHSVGKYAQSLQLFDNKSSLQVWATNVWDLETEIEVVTERLHELLSRFSARWTAKGLATFMVTAELLDLFYLRINFDMKGFHVDPISFELQEPDWLSGERDRIRAMDLQTCQGAYFNFEALQLNMSLNLNVKRCEASIVDWLTGKGASGPGFHLTCFYENDNEIEMADPIHF